MNLHHPYENEGDESNDDLAGTTSGKVCMGKVFVQHEQLNDEPICLALRNFVHNARIEMVDLSDESLRAVQDPA